jgi:hypothetical protein
MEEKRKEKRGEEGREDGRRKVREKDRFTESAVSRCMSIHRKTRFIQLLSKNSCTAYAVYPR